MTIQREKENLLKRLAEIKEASSADMQKKYISAIEQIIHDTKEDKLSSSDLFIFKIISEKLFNHSENNDNNFASLFKKPVSGFQKKVEKILQHIEDELKKPGKSETAFVVKNRKGAAEVINQMKKALK